MSHVPFDQFVLHHPVPEIALFRAKQASSASLVMQHKVGSA